MDYIFSLLQIPLSDDRSYVAAIVCGTILISSTAVTYKLTPSATQDSGSASDSDNVTRKYKATIRTFDSFFVDVLPQEFQYETAWNLFRRQIRLSHPLGVLRSKPEGISQTKHVWLCYTMKLLAILSSNVVVALLYYPEKRHCSSQHTQASCTNDSTLYILGNLCAWNSNQSTCVESTSNEKLAFILLVVFATTALASAVDKFLRFALTHAALAVRDRRMAWLYCCCFCPETAVTGHRSRILVSGKAVRVVPVLGSAEDDIERGTDSSMEEGGGLRLKPRPIQANLSVLLPRRLPFAGLVFGSAGQQKRAASLRELLEGEEAALTHFGDDWYAAQVQSRKATLLRAARFSLMRSHMDYVSVAEERQHMLQHSRERYLWMEASDRPLRGSNLWDATWRKFRLRQLRWFHFGDPTTALELMHLAHLKHVDLIDHNLRSSRTRATALRARLLRQPDDAARDLYLMRAFLEASLSGHKRVVARAVLFEAAEIMEARKERVIWQYFALLTVPAYVIVSLAIIFYGGLAVRGPAAVTWVYCALASLLLELLCVQPAKIWFLQVWAPGAAKKDVLALHWVLQLRARSLLARRKGLLNSVNALVQHFHPACRAARLVPHLPVARLLLSLSDHDLPFRAVQQRPRRRDVRYPTAQVLNTGSPLVSDRSEAIFTNAYSAWRYVYNIARTCTMALLRLALHALYLLPQWAREVVVEVGCAGALVGFLLLVFLTNRSDPSHVLTGIVVALALCSCAIAVYKAYRDVRRERQVLDKLARQRERYELVCNPPVRNDSNLMPI